MNLDGLGSTPWVDRTLTRVWDRVAAVVPETWLPVLAGSSTPKRVNVVEYGCGHYGCVMPTREPELVCKLTSDVTEARFVVRAMTLDHPGGIVEYKGIYALRDVERSAGWGHKRPMFVLWRTEAYDVGLLLGFPYSIYGMGGAIYKFVKDDYDKRTLLEGVRLLNQFQHEAATVRKYVKPRLQAAADKKALLSEVWRAYEQSQAMRVDIERNYRKFEAYGAPSWVKGLRRVGVALANCRAITQELSNTPIVNKLGDALGHYLEEGLLLADVHEGNIGVYDNELIVTDPGHVVEVHPRWSEPLTVQEI